jgi:CRISPR-associated protein Cas2
MKVLPSGYKLMWMMVMFDLPTNTKKDRHKASKFRRELLELGFEMNQYSVYLRFCGDRSKLRPYINAVKTLAPSSGKISLLFFTDKQFSDTINIHNREISQPAGEPEQMTLF